ncbi:TPA: hypothetical protein HA273_05890 [Candidatus Bathyarchaeota archaeon]|nr:hypothetical protein [Candidatus Bathyarchaeota archaeon]HIJ08746.1 hypothetical protein [Candidatus Bathyarchaeota archaeon]
MTSAEKNRMQLFVAVAQSNFKAACGHPVTKGQQYVVFNDYIADKNLTLSNCRKCAVK